MGIKITRSKRLDKLPPYLFVELEKLKKQARAGGKDVIDLGVGDPDQPTPQSIVKALCEAVQEPSTHKYALDAGITELRQEIANWYKNRFGVKLDPDTEVLPLIGSKEGIAHIPLAFINPGDAALVPNPCYPPYRSGVIFAGGEVIDLPLLSENGFLPDLLKLGRGVARKAKLAFLNYPNNPTSGSCGKDFFASAVEFANKNNIIICHDAAYSEITYDGYVQPSFLEAAGAMEVGVEFHSLSKTYNMTGWRIGFACGNAAIIKELAKVKANIDSGIFTAIQRAGLAALRMPQSHLGNLRDMYQSRRDCLVDGLNSIGWQVEKPKATFYIWTRLPKGSDSTAFAKQLIEEAGVVATPGVGFGKYGEGFIRMALTVSEERMKEAVGRIKKVL